MKIILFDLDRTLFDTDWFGVRMRQILEEMTGFKYEVIQARIDVYKNGLESNLWFDFRELVKDFADSDEEYSKIVHAFVSDQTAFRVYDDVRDCLSNLKDKGYTLGIFSEGVEWFQEIKLDKIGIRKYLGSELLFIGLNKRTKEFLDQIPEGAVIVDDNPEVIEVLENDGRFVPVWLNRKGLEWEYEREIGGLEELEAQLIRLGSLDYARDDR